MTQAMRQDVTADAAVMGRELKAAGKTIIYGIYFGTGSAVIKPESEPALAEMVKLLKGTPTLKAFIVGHTDNVGTLETNLTLSVGRADALVKALISRGIAAARLKPAGVGPYSPIAPNKDEQGRDGRATLGDARRQDDDAPRDDGSHEGAHAGRKGLHGDVPLTEQMGSTACAHLRWLKR